MPHNGVSILGLESDYLGERNSLRIHLKVGLAIVSRLNLPGGLDRKSNSLTLEFRLFFHT